MNYGSISKSDIADGPGIRVTLFVSGCRNRCIGCHNAETWDFGFGGKYTPETEREILSALDHTYVRGLTLCGGEPFEEENQPELEDLLRKVRERFPDKDVWAWTGYEYEDLTDGGRKHIACTDGLLSMIDVLVVGPFVLGQRDITDGNRWRGSRNQRVIDLNATRKRGEKTFLGGIPNNE